MINLVFIRSFVSRYSRFILLFPIFGLILSSCNSGDSIQSSSDKSVSTLKFGKVPLFVIDINICNNEGLKTSVNSCIDTSVLVWGANSLSNNIDNFSPIVYFYRENQVAKYLDTDAYRIVVSSFGCYSDHSQPNSTESYHTLNNIELSIDRNYTNSKKIFAVPNSSITIRKVSSQKDYDTLIPFDISSQQISTSKRCKILSNFSI